MREYLERIFTGTYNEYKKEIDNMISSGKKEFIITANPEILMKAQKESDLDEMLLSDSVSIVPDGISVVKALRANGIDAKERITGVDLAEYLLDKAGRENLSVYLLGAKEEIVSTLVKNYKEKYSGYNIKYKNGYDGDKDKIFDEIAAEQPDIVIVALGVPAQERLIYKHLDRFEKGIFIGVGGSFDVLSGLKKRAPSFFIKTNTEWLYRIAKEPSRLKRFFDSNVKFMHEVKKK